MRTILGLVPAALLVACSASHEQTLTFGGASADSPPPLSSPAASLPPIAAGKPARAPAMCASGDAPQAYLWARDGTLFAFDPETLETRALGVVSCPASASPFTLAVSRSGTAYLMYSDWSIYAVDLATLICSTTPYTPGQLGVSGYEALAIGAQSGAEADRLYVYEGSSSAVLGVSDVSSFLLFEEGPVTPGADGFMLDLKVDPYERMFALGMGGVLLQLDPATGIAVGQDQTGFDGGDTWALLSYEDRLYFIGGTTGAVSRYDATSKALFPVGQINQMIVGAAAVPCMPASSAANPGIAGSAAANPFSPGDAWIGTYGCEQGVTDLALVIDTVSGNTMTGRFDFNWTEGNAFGTYDVTGSFDPATREVQFTPGTWVTQPGSSWVTVAMDGYVDLSGLDYSGDITFEGCGAFSVHR